jgi:hypothetical protein
VEHYPSREYSSRSPGQEKQNFVESETSLPCVRDPVTDPCTQAFESSPHSHTVPLMFTLILSSPSASLKPFLPLRIYDCNLTSLFVPVSAT